MTDPRRALDLAAELRGVLDQQLALARGEPERLRAMDSDALLKTADQRGRLHASASALLGKLTLARDGGTDAPPLASALADIRKSAAALKQLDSVNRELAERSLGVVRGLLNAGSNRSAAYDRRGARVESQGPVLQSRRA